MYVNIIEGKLPNIYVSADVAEQLDEKAQYTKNKGMDDASYPNFRDTSLSSLAFIQMNEYNRLIGQELQANHTISE